MSNLLIVDDDIAFCEVLKRTMDRRGYSAVFALDSAQALEIARQENPSHAIVDLRIGEESGLSLVRELVTLLPDIRIVMLTGYASIATAVEAIKLGATHYLTKPADPEEIIASFEKETGDHSVTPAAKPLSVQRLEWEHIQKVLQEHDGNISAAARAMGMHRRTLQRKLQKRPVRN